MAFFFERSTLFLHAKCGFVNLSIAARIRAKLVPGDLPPLLKNAVIFPVAIEAEFGHIGAACGRVPHERV
ncbi:hypothetical protein [Aquamicrobium sp. LC103]|uniref:hypothetical protein n=1 Tax=Aquamicrobium sp. LC103 TaxID=1120658 RepID=UPI0009E576D0|nr:hypothetical protein [Aquamicrobium sp. LC103]TKT82904.1 hypothetical protein XW59_002775 [Aquamicrobium sp. LC103]